MGRNIVYLCKLETINMMYTTTTLIYYLKCKQIEKRKKGNKHTQKKNM